MAKKESNSISAAKNLALGIDLGTTTVKICVVDSDSREIIHETYKKTDADLDVASLQAAYAGTSVTNFDGFSEQDVRKIWSPLNSLLQALGPSVASLITRIGVCGQQHGLMLWNEASCRAFTQLDQDIPNTCQISNLITWQDQRCTEKFRSTLPAAQPSDQVLATGYGACSLFWLAKNAPEKLAAFDRSGTVVDFVAWMLASDGQIGCMSEQNAETWGYYDRFGHSWNTDILKAEGFPVTLLPGSAGGKDLFVGNLRGGGNWHGISGDDGVAVGVAMGDLQCSFLASIQHETDAVLNFSTSSQISFIRARSDLPIPPSCDVRTYFLTSNDTLTSHSGRELITAPSLNGGNVLTCFVQTIKNWSNTLGATENLTDAAIWSKIIVLANETDWTTAEAPVVRPTLYGERFDPTLKAEVRNLGLANCDLGSVVRGILKGVLANLEAMLPAELLQQSGVKRIVLTGSLFKTFPQLSGQVLRVFGLPVVMKNDTRDAAYGAAVAVSCMTR